MPSMLARIDPRQSLAAAIAWEVAAITLLAATLASAWFATAARDSVEQQIGATFRQYATQISNEIDINLYGELQSLQSIRAATSFLSEIGTGEAAQRIGTLLPKLRSELPEMEWIAFADPAGRVLAATGAGAASDTDVTHRRWFIEGRRAAWIGDVHDDAVINTLPGSQVLNAPLVELSVPVFDAKGGLLGVIGAQLGLEWIRATVASLTTGLRAQQSVDTLLVARDGLVLAGPKELLGQHLQGETQSASKKALAVVSESLAQHKLPPPELTSGRLVAAWQDGPAYLLGFAVSDGGGAFPGGTGWTVWVRESEDSAFGPVREQWRANLTTIALLGLLTIVGGVLLTNRLTRRLTKIADSADDIRAGRRSQLEVPGGTDEAARIGQSLQNLLDELAARNHALEQLNAELDQRVAARTREVERLAEENREAAMVRERLRFARNLHDTLAHSIMELLMQIRLLRKLGPGDSARLQEELATAEAAAREGLRRARGAIAELRSDTVRDQGLAASLRQLATRMGERTGIAVEFTADAACATPTNNVAETIYRIAEEALSNIERHAQASRVRIELHPGAAGGRAQEIVLEIEDNGIGLDPDMSAHPGRYGLRGMHELAEIIGATIDIQPGAQHGTRVCLWAPAAAPADHTTASGEVTIS